MKWIRSHLSFANVISVIALFVALGGASYAAVTLPKNSVGAKQIKKNAVERAKIKSNAVDSSKVKNGSLTGSDIKLSSLGAVPSATNATNATNATHAASSAALDRAIIRTASGSTAGPPASATASCDAGFRPLSGGANVTDPVTAFIIDTYPELGGWTARVGSDGTASSFTVYVICAPVGTVN